MLIIELLTDHLTSFALLLGGNNNNCSNNENENNVIAWLSLGFVAVAILFVMLGVVAIEVRIRAKRLNINQNFRDISRITKEAKG